MDMTPEQEIRYSRQLSLPGWGKEGQEKLARAKILIIGAGGLGSPAAFYLAAAGIGQIGIADGDDVELSNLQRQILHATADLGVPKPLSAAESLRALNPRVRIVPILEFATAYNLPSLIRDYDFVLSCTDTLDSKLLISDACVKDKKPFCHGGLWGFEGQVLTWLPGRGPCLRCIFPDAPTVQEVPQMFRPGVLGPAAGTVGCIQAAEALKYILGIGELLTGRLLTFNALNMNCQIIRIGEANPECTACR